MPTADLQKIKQFTTGEWAGLNELFVDERGEWHTYPHIADGFSGYVPFWELEETPQKHSPLRDVEEALNNQTHWNNDPLRALSYAAGMVALSDNNDIFPWQIDGISEAFNSLGLASKNGLPLDAPDRLTERKDYKKYYNQIRKMESERLLVQIAELAEVIENQNLEEQLYASHPRQDKYGWHSSQGGWLAPLIGLSIKDNRVNGYRHQVHNVFPVVYQNDGVAARMGKIARRGLYTAYAPHEGTEYYKP